MGKQISKHEHELLHVVGFKLFCEVTLDIYMAYDVMKYPKI